VRGAIAKRVAWQLRGAERIRRTWRQPVGRTGVDGAQRKPVAQPELIGVARPAVERPGKIVCVGLNYRDHAEEQGAELPGAPLLFAKFPTALIGPGDPIVIPPLVTKCDYEAELGVVLGSTVKQVSKENALEAVAGYLVANDVSARDLQFGDGQWTRGKSPDTFCPVGPLVAAADVPDPHALSIRALLNGEVVQDSTTANLVFGVDEVISYASQTATLEAGDLILTGTPAGVGIFRKPPRLLEPGDEITIEIDGVGTLTNPVTGA
jgi:2-keto-4-pentenoate hydratase/2-oxohepta-3-ene-1,7-dioic acid hydratase in catechol pathway